MEPQRNDELDDLELDRILREWQVPQAPARLRASVFPKRVPWWRMSVTVPAPVLCAIALLALVAIWRWSPRQPPGLDFNEWKPVTELRPVVMRSIDVAK